jgi:hypothetical protein
MSDLKAMNDEVISQIPFEVKLVEDFPAWFVYRAGMAIVLNEKFKVGVVYNHSSTGSRLSYADYSGEYHFDITTQGNSIGLLLGYNVFQYKNIDIQFDATIGAMLSTCNFSENLNVYAIQQSDNLSMKSASFVAMPELSVNYWFGLFGAGLFGAYQYDVGGQLNLSGQKSTTTTNWSGFRGGVVLRLKFPKKVDKGTSG